jgi:hypothetical protein
MEKASDFKTECLMQTKGHLFSIKKEFERFTMFLREDGIVQIDVFPEEEITIEDVKQGVEYLKEIGGGKKFPLLFIAQEYSMPSDATREFLADRNSIPFSIAEAFVICSLPQKIVGNFYLRVNKPARPTQIFTKETDALIWLNSFL